MRSTAIVQKNEYKIFCEQLQILAQKDKLDAILDLYIDTMQQNSFETTHQAILQIADQKSWKGLKELALYNIEIDEQFSALLNFTAPSLKKTIITQSNQHETIRKSLQDLAEKDKLDDILKLYIDYIKTTQEDQFDKLHLEIMEIAKKYNWKGLEELALHNIATDRQLRGLLKSAPPSAKDEKNVANLFPTTAIAQTFSKPSALPVCKNALLKLIKEFKQTPSSSIIDAQINETLTQQLQSKTTAAFYFAFSYLIKEKLCPNRQFFVTCIALLRRMQFAEHANEITLFFEQKNAANHFPTTTNGIASAPLISPDDSNALLELIKQFKKMPKKSIPSKQIIESEINKSLTQQLHKKTISAFHFAFSYLIRENFFPDELFFETIIFFLYEMRLYEHVKEIYLFLGNEKKLTSSICQWAIACAKHPNEVIDVDFSFGIYQQSINFNLTKNRKLHNEMIKIAALNSRFDYAQYAYETIVSLNIADSFTYSFAINAAKAVDKINFAEAAYNKAISSGVADKKFFEVVAKYCSKNNSKNSPEEWKKLANRAAIDASRSQFFPPQNTRLNLFNPSAANITTTSLTPTYPATTALRRQFF